MSECKGFTPVVNSHSKLLILGSMPSIVSLSHKQYYAHPQNRFWRLMAKLLGYEITPVDYGERLKMILDRHIALWDSIAFCEREGSLDSAIQKETPNDFNEFFQRYRNINMLCFNGGKAYQCFKKYNKQILDSNKYIIYLLPSTSPANARFKMEMLEEKWQIILKQS
ncbi:DNA-deoxyinosine glycosylase [Pectinatus haikarae]|uniref:DNA-deoxyinosine glycosylase n=1 Tax=Pectinatus haikarae TaxID=349096 RepID=UPI0018C4BB62|nr:DNA-deoxyinosine glycosylase [Pectinatus haikarae]